MWVRCPCTPPLSAGVDSSGRADSSGQAANYSPTTLLLSYASTTHLLPAWPTSTAADRQLLPLGASALHGSSSGRVPQPTHVLHVRTCATTYSPTTLLGVYHNLLARLLHFGTSHQNLLSRLHYFGSIRTHGRAGMHSTSQLPKPPCNAKRKRRAPPRTCARIPPREFCGVTASAAGRSLTFVHNCGHVR